MNIKEELHKRIFGWLEDWYEEENLDPSDVNNVKFIFDHSDEFDKRKKANDLKYNMVEIPEEDNCLYGITKFDTIVCLTINNKKYFVACAERLYCQLGEYKWRSF